MDVGRIRRKIAERTFRVNDRIPRKVRNVTGLRSPELSEDWNIFNEENEDRTRDDSEINESGIERDKVG